MDANENGNTGSSLSNELPEEIVFHYIKSNSFRVIRAAGVWGGLNARGEVCMNLWSERPPIPRRVVHEVTSAKTLGEERRGEREGLEGVIREVEVSAVMTIHEAESLAKWLLEKVEDHKRIVAASSE